METIKQVLMRRDNMSSEDADALIQDAKDDIARIIENYEDPYEGHEEAEEVIYDYFGLEPDYLMELI